MDRIRENSTVKEIAEKFPVTRKIFDTYGIMCGGDSLPDKPISFFARMHNINPSTLIEDLQNLIDGKEVENDEVSLIKPQTEHIYEFFIKTSIIIVLSTGCLYGAVMLAYMHIRDRSFPFLGCYWRHTAIHKFMDGWDYS